MRVEIRVVFEQKGDRCHVKASLKRSDRKELLQLENYMGTCSNIVIPLPTLIKGFLVTMASKLVDKAFDNKEV